MKRTQVSCVEIIQNFSVIRNTDR